MTKRDKHYAVAYFAIVAAIMIVGIAIEIIGIDLPTGMSIYLPPMLAAMMTMQHPKYAADAPTLGRAKWRLALRFTGIAIIMQIIVTVLSIGVMTLAGSRVLLDLLQSFTPVIWVVAVVVMVLVVWLSNRAGISLAALVQNKMSGPKP